jgi:hypothetical protein
MSAETLAIVVSILAVIIAAVAIWKSGKPVTFSGITTTLDASVPLAQELATVALTATQAAEQLYRTGKITRDARLDHAFAYARKWFPDLDQAQILTALEAAVLVVNSIVGAMPHNAVNSKPTPPQPRVGPTGLV